MLSLSFIVFDGASPWFELNNARDRAWSSKVSVFANTTAAEKAFKEIEEEKTREQEEEIESESHDQKHDQENEQDNSYSH